MTTRDPHYDMQLMRDLAIINARTQAELGPLPLGGIPVEPKRKPKPWHQSVSAQPDTEDDSMKLSQAVIAATLGMVGVLTTACRPEETSTMGHVTEAVQASEKPALADSKGAPESGASPEMQLGAKYKEGMPYHSFRKMLIADGWSPAANSDECLSLSIGDNYKDHCSKEDAPSMCRICMEFSEISACTDDGYCYMDFSKRNEYFSIKTYGDILRIRDEASEPVVKKWNISGR